MSARSRGFTGGLSAKRGGISIIALLIIIATGFRSLACATKPSRCASSGMLPPPAKGSSNGGGFPSVAMRISGRAGAMIFPSVVASQVTSRSMKSNRRMRGLSPLARTFGPSPGNSRLASTKAGSAFGSSGSSTMEAKMTARVVARGFRAHHRCRVEGWPWRMDFSRALAALMASKGRATSISFLAGGVVDSDT